MRCPYCGDSTAQIKKGVKSGKQRWGCKVCHRRYVINQRRYRPPLIAHEIPTRIYDVGTPNEIASKFGIAEKNVRYACVHHSALICRKTLGRQWLVLLQSAEALWGDPDTSIDGDLSTLKSVTTIAEIAIKYGVSYSYAKYRLENNPSIRCRDSADTLLIDVHDARALFDQKVQPDE